MLLNPSKTKVIAETNGMADPIDPNILTHRFRDDLVAEDQVLAEEITQG